MMGENPLDDQYGAAEKQMGQDLYQATVEQKKVESEHMRSATLHNQQVTENIKTKGTVIQLVSLVACFSFIFAMVPVLFFLWRWALGL